jgi:hypothetical protein
MFVLRELYQRTERTLVNSVNSGYPRVIAFPCCAIRVKAPEATFRLRSAHINDYIHWVG